METDAVLLDQYVKTNDAQAFAQLVRRHAGLVFGVALRITQNKQDAEDIAQTCFVELSRHARTVHSSVAGWLHQIARWRALDTMQKSKTRAENEEVADHISEKNGTENSEWGEVKSCVDEALGKISEDVRSLLILHYLEGMDQQKMAEQLHVNQSTISRRLDDGIGELRKELKKMGVAIESVSFGLGALLLSNCAVTPPPSLIAALGKLAMAGTGNMTPIATGAGKTGITALMHSRLTLKVVVALVAVAVVGGAVAVNKKSVAPRNFAGSVTAAGSQGDSKALLGSVDFYPSPERPVGWRGDWTGKFPGATPPLEWGRWPKGPFKKLRCKVEKPSGEPSGDPISHGFVKYWLLAGPYDIQDIPKALDEELISKESELQPTTGDKAGTGQWKAYEGRVLAGRGCVPVIAAASDFMDAKYRPLAKPYAAYLHSYVYSPCEAKVRATFQVWNTIGAKVWHNGTLLYKGEPTPSTGPADTLRDVDQVITLSKGWNRFLVKTCTPGAHGHIQGFSGIRLLPIPPVEYETENVRWMLQMSSASVATPLVVGDKLIVCSDPNFVLCLNRNDGKVLWATFACGYDALSDSDKQAVKGEAEPLLRQRREALEAFRGAMNANNRKEISGVRISLESVRKKLSALAEPKLGIAIGTGSLAVQTPCCDGERIYVGSPCGLTAALDMNGNVLWGQVYKPHGTHHTLASSPVVMGGACFATGLDDGQRTVYAYEAKTGKPLWKSGKGVTYASLMPLRWNGEQAVLSWDMVRASDGKVLWGFRSSKLTYGSFGAIGTPIVEDGQIFAQSGEASEKIYALKLPAALGEQAALEAKTIQFERYPMAAKYGDCYFCSSLLYHEGLLYNVSIFGGLRVLDVAAGKQVYKQVLPLAPNERYSFAGGVDASPALAGKRIYIVDNIGTTVVFEPGREYKQVAVNSLINLNDKGGPGMDAEFESTPVFVGADMYLRSGSYVYCISQK